MIVKTFTFLRRMFLPPFCISCKRFAEEDIILCAECLGRIRPIVSKTIELTPQRRIPVYAVGAYDGPLIPLILAKSYGNRAMAHQLGIIAWQHTVISHIPFDYIVPIPLHWSRYAWRGYNQAHEIARVIAQRTGKPIAPLLVRNRRTDYQSYFKGADRLANVAHIFSVQGRDLEQYRNKHILLVDDVMTSGATLKEAARVIYELKPIAISALVIARAG